MLTSVAFDTRTDITVLSVAGDVDIAVTPDLRAAIDETLALGAATLVIDLAQVTFTDSRGISALVKGRVAADVAGTGFQLRNVPPPVRRVLEITGSLDYLGGMAADSAMA